MVSSSSRNSFIDNQRSVLLDELAQCRQRAETAKQAMGAAYPAACQAAQSMRPVFEEGLAQARRNTLQKGRKGTWGAALSLRASLGTGGVRNITWLLLLGSLVLYGPVRSFCGQQSYTLPFHVSQLSLLFV